MTLYKLTNAKNQTHGKTQWGENVTHTASGKGALCTAGWIHVYKHPLLAVVCNPIHANFQRPKLWLASGKVGISDGLKVGCKSLTTLKQIELPKISMTALVRFAIYCALKIYHDKQFVRWTKIWLNGKDRSASAANVASDTAYAALGTAYAAAACAAAHAADAAAHAADAAADAAAHAKANAVRNAAYAAVHADEYVVKNTKKISFVLLLKKAIRDEKKYEKFVDGKL